MTKQDFPYAHIGKQELIEILQQSEQENIALCFGKCVLTAWIPGDMHKAMYKKCFNGRAEEKE